MKKTKYTSIILAAAIAAAAVVPTTAFITHEATALDSSVDWVPAAGPGPAQPGPVTDEDKAKKRAPGGNGAWWDVDRSNALKGRYALEVAHTEGTAIADLEMWGAAIPADATYVWWVDGAPVTEPASLPVKPHSMPRDLDQHAIQLVFSYTLGGETLTHTTHAEGIQALDRR